MMLLHLTTAKIKLKTNYLFKKYNLVQLNLKESIYLTEMELDNQNNILLFFISMESWEEIIALFFKKVIFFIMKMMIVSITSKSGK